MQEKKIVGIKYEDRFYPGTFSGKEYSYFTDIELEVGDLVEAPTKYGKSIALVTATNIPKEKIKGIEEFMKTITIKLNKEKEEKENGNSII